MSWGQPLHLRIAGAGLRLHLLCSAAGQGLQGQPRSSGTACTCAAVTLGPALTWEPWILHG